MAAQALGAACDQARIPPGELDAVIVASEVPEQPMPTTGVLVLRQLGLGLDDVDMVIPHQVSEVGLRYLRERLGVPVAKVTDILATRGNQVSASLPSALDAAVSSGALHRGDIALLLGTAAGLSAGAAVIRY